MNDVDFDKAVVYGEFVKALMKARDLKIPIKSLPNLFSDAKIHVFHGWRRSLPMKIVRWTTPTEDYYDE